MSTQQRIHALVSLAAYLRNTPDAALQQAMEKARHQNPWFTDTTIRHSLTSIANGYLEKQALETWLSNYPALPSPKIVGMVMAGNIPLVGFHDFLCGYLAGHVLQIKLSEKDAVLLPFLISMLSKYDHTVSERVHFVDRLSGFDAVIATGSNNASIYFKSYFEKYPHIIRKNRNGVAVLTGNETTSEWIELGRDIFDYFGLGCRNVSKLYVPENYDFEPLLSTWHDAYKDVVLHHKYKNNFDYNMALFMLNKEPFLNNGCVLLKADERLASRIASVHYEFYKDIDDLTDHLQTRREEIQCISASAQLGSLPTIDFGQSQEPTLTDYADGIDTMDFMMRIP